MKELWKESAASKNIWWIYQVTKKPTITRLQLDETGRLCCQAIVAPLKSWPKSNLDCLDVFGHFFWYGFWLFGAEFGFPVLNSRHLQIPEGSIYETNPKDHAPLKWSNQLWSPHTAWFKFRAPKMSWLLKLSLCNMGNIVPANLVI